MTPSFILLHGYRFDPDDDDTGPIIDLGDAPSPVICRTDLIASIDIQRLRTQLHGRETEPREYTSVIAAHPSGRLMLSYVRETIEEVAVLLSAARVWAK